MEEIEREKWYRGGKLKSENESFLRSAGGGGELGR